MDSDVFRDTLRRPRQRRPWLWVLALGAVLFVCLPAIAAISMDWLWYQEIGRADVYWTLVWGRWLLALGIGAVFFLFVFGNVFAAIKRTPEMAWSTLGNRLRERALDLLNRTLRRVAVWGAAVVAAFLALAMARSAALYWPQFLVFARPQYTGQVDPIFGHDIGFYLFQLPVWELISTWVASTLLVALVLTGIVYLMTGGLRLVRRIPVLAPAAHSHLSLLLALYFLARIGGYLLDRYALLYQDNGNFVGVGYADVHARIPGLVIMAGLAAFAALLMFINIWKRSILLPILTVCLLVLASVVVRGIYPAAVQRFRVEPNELDLQRPYIAHHIQLTRRAFGLEQVQTPPEFTPQGQLSAGDVAQAPTTINNVRLWDYRPLQQVYRQRQELRPYYQVHDVDVDRYRLNGQLRQVMVSARELNAGNIPDGQSWLNRHLIYTHGYGVVMSPVNEIAEGKGEPVFFVNDIPPKSTVDGLAVTRPEIYFGELDPGYSVVRTRQPEFDYPSGDNVYTTYQGNAGIALANPVIRSLAAIHFGDVNLLISDAITAESRLLMRREITERVRAAAPFFEYDIDPYIVVGEDGKLYWIIDAYTRSLRYPYSRPTQLATTGGTTQADYVRNPVKAVVDAYDGAVRFYQTDTTDPIANAWGQVFPGLLRPVAEMPAGLDQHVRVPEGLFNAISEVYARYHMTDPKTFYSQEDMWTVPKETVSDSRGGKDDQTMEGYYVVMSLPGQSEPEYLLIRPYTPSGKSNMIAWLSARNDPGRLGDLLVYNFPKQSLVLGPQQVQAQINQDTDISKDISLWDQAGSRVLWGNLLAIPIQDTVLYVQPVYLQAEQSQIPELQRVVVADQQRVVMRTTLKDALDALTGGRAPLPGAPASTTSGTPPAPTAPGPDQQRTLARSALDHYNRAQEALKQGNWATYGQEMEAMRKDLETLQK